MIISGEVYVPDNDNKKDTGGNHGLPHLSGHSTPDALRILHDELQGVITVHDVNQRLRTNTSKWLHCFLHHNHRHSALHWTNCLVVLLLAFFLIVAYGAQQFRDHWLVVEALLLLVAVVVNVYGVGLDEKLKVGEIIKRTQKVLKTINDCIEGLPWQSEHYISIHAPLAPSVSLQWTYRDGVVVNLPSGFLVEGDIILLRAGQLVPAKCRTLQYFPQLLGDAEIQQFNAGDIFNPEMSRESSTDMFSQPQMRDPLKPCPFIMLETPFVQNLKTMIAQGEKRPVSVLNNERYMVYSVWIEQRILPGIFVLMLITNVLRFLFLWNYVGHWTDMFIVLQVEAVLPLTALVLPLMWKLLDAFGVAKLIIVFKRFRGKAGHIEMKHLAEFGSEDSVSGPAPVLWTRRELWRSFHEVLCGEADTLPRTSNLTHVLGNVTSLCCVDKKGVLSWPNPTAEKVFFLRNDLKSRDKQWSSESAPSLDNDSGSVHMDSFEDDLKSVSTKNVRPDHDFLLETNFEVLDLTPDAKNGYSLQFDDSSWKRFLSSLKPLGLNILLNTCNLQTSETYTQFADHVTCASLKRERAAPVLNRRELSEHMFESCPMYRRRCFCELARQIGFSEHARKIFKLQEMLGMYRHLQSKTIVKNHLLPNNKAFIKYKMPMPNMFSVVVKEVNTGMLQLMSQGTADMLLDSCSDYWDGHDLCPLSEIDRKKIADFYHRTSMMSYCTAFSYRPLTQNISKEFQEVFLEIPELHEHLYPQVHSPTPTKSWDTESLDSRLQSGKSHYQCSMDSLLTNTESNSIHDVDGAFRIQCNQVFIGMITMQYQARQDIVQLIEDLESACIRFVHFSKENELRSRVFSEKMGLEAGWNCHISLLSEKHGDHDTTLPMGQQDSAKTDTSTKTDHFSSHSHDSLRGLTQGVKSRWSNDSIRCRRGSAPGAVNLEVTQVKFESGSPTIESPVISLVSENLQKHPNPGESGSTNSSESPAAVPYETVVKDSILAPVTVRNPNKPCLRRDSDEHSDKMTDPLLRRSHSKGSDGRELKFDPTHDIHRGYGGVEEAEIELLEVRSLPEENDAGGEENLSTSESYPASSHFTETTDSVTGGFLTNTAKLPKGIDDIRPHIENVDNVPLLVPLFTDCTPETTQEMVSILQQYGEVVCCLGSSANIHNTGIFLRADCSLAVEPQYPQVCMCEPVVGGDWNRGTPGPLELHSMLNSIPCTLSFNRDDTISLLQLIAQARDHVQGVRHTFLLLLNIQLSLVMLQLLASVCLLPPILGPQHIIWLAAFALPALALTMNGNPLDSGIMKKALGKNIQHLTPQVIFEFLLYFGVGCVPSIAVCLISHATILLSFCYKVAAPTNATCHMFYGQVDYGSTGSWNGWVADYSAGLALSQNFVAFQFVLYSVCVSLCFIHRYHHLWQRSPLVNKTWCTVAPILLVLQLVYFAADVGISNRVGATVFLLSDVPVAVWVLALVWPIGLIAFQEIIKRREKKLSVRYQKRARLDFGTKLGMNSPF